MNGMTGIITGRLPERGGRYVVRLLLRTAAQSEGRPARKCILVKATNLNSKTRSTGLRFLALRGNSFNRMRPRPVAGVLAGPAEVVRTDADVAACARMVQACTLRQIVLE